MTIRSIRRKPVKDTGKCPVCHTALLTCGRSICQSCACLRLHWARELATAGTGR